MKSISFIMAVFAIFSVTMNKAKACAACFDLFPKTVVLDELVQKDIQKVFPMAKNTEVAFNYISCEKQSEYLSDGEAKCTLGLDGKDVVISGLSAKVLLGHFINLTAEVDGSVDDDWKREGRFVKVGNTNKSGSKTSYELGLFGGSYYSCPDVKGTQRCELTIRVTTIEYIPELK